MKKWCVMGAVLLAGVQAASAQSQYQTAFEAGIGYTRPGTGRFDMLTLLVQGDEYVFESGIGLAVNGGLNGDTAFSWLIRGGFRPLAAGNTLIHVGGEFSVHTNSAVDAGGVKSLSSVGFLVGASHPLSDHLNFEVHVFPFLLEFGNSDTVTRLLTAQVGAHILF